VGTDLLQGNIVITRKGVQKKDGKNIVKRFGWFVISNDSHSKVGIIDIGNITSQEVKANLGIELKEDERTNEENYDEYIADNIFLVL